MIMLVAPIARTLFILLLLAAAGGGTAAHADVWTRALDPEPQLDVYEALMMKGDESAIAANARQINQRTILKNIDIAIEAYRGAAKARPKSGEPHFRIASVLNSFFLECSDPLKQKNLPSTCHMSNAQIERRALEALDAWDAFESLVPLDPRVNEILLARALLRTKLVVSTPKPQSLLRAAAKDYQSLIDREDGFYAGSGSEMILGNLAETHMMLGDMEKAIEGFKAAVRAGGGSSTIYGLAVALDRDERGELALKLIRQQGPEALIEFERKFDLGAIFFVPAGEEHYYFGLAHLAFGNIDEATAHFRSFIRSGAHPQFQPRAKEHLDKLMSRQILRWKAPITPRDLDLRHPFPSRRRK